MRNSIMIIACLAGGAIFLNAETLSPEAALQRAIGNTPAKIGSLAAQPQGLKLIYTSTIEAEPAAYVFGGENSYMIVSADDVAAPLLGYADNATIDPENMPDALRYWLGEYAREIEAARAVGAPAYTAARSNSSWTAIAPLLSTLWNQSAPYNDLTPSKSGVHAVTGCVATAMAQKMKYHNYPDVGEGSNTYSAMEQTISLNFAEYPFDWASMLNTYTASATAEQRKAVAQLMYACGVSVNMSYSTSESGAQSVKIPVALINNFKYSKSSHLLFRDYYSLSQFEEIIYEELTTVGPVVYSGSTANGEGHCYVLDGYNGNGYWHMNWGWGGLSDGYFLLTALNPDAMGIGGATSASDGFNYEQQILVGAKANPEGEYYMQLIGRGNLKITVNGNTFSVTTDDTNLQFYNGSAVNISGTIGLNVIDAQGNSQYFKSSTSLKDLLVGYGLRNYSATISGLADGTYTVKPAWVSKDYVNRDIPMMINKVQSYTLVVSGGKYTVTPNAYNPHIQITDVRPATSDLYAGKRLKFDLEIENTSTAEYLNTIQGGLFKNTSTAQSGKKPDYSGSVVLIDVEPGKTINYLYLSSFVGSSSMDVPAAGEYKLCFFNPSTYEWLGDCVNVTLQQAPASGETVLKASDFQLKGGVDYITDKTDVEFHYNLTCEAGLLDGTLRIGIFREGATASWLSNFETQQILLYAGESGSYTSRGSLSTLIKVGTTYDAYLILGTTAKGEKLAGPVTFTYVDPNASIEGVEGDEEPVSVEYYNTLGMKVDGKGAGLYIVVKRYADGRVATSKERL